MFSNTPGGAKASATLYSIIETAKENGLYPFDYLEFVFRTAPGLDLRNDHAVLDRLMPWNALPDLRRIDTPSKASPWDVI